MSKRWELFIALRTGILVERFDTNQTVSKDIFCISETYYSKRLNFNTVNK